MSWKKSAIFLFLGLLILPSAFARKPAVEDFVGVEPESFVRTPQGTEVLVDFGNTVQAFEKEKPSFWTEWTPSIVLTSFILLPFAMWFGITRSANNAQKSMEEADNVASLSDYKNKSGHGPAESEDKEDFKQAS